MTAKDNTGTKRPLIILTGPTAVGKTALSIGLAKKQYRVRSYLQIQCRFIVEWILARRRSQRNRWMEYRTILIDIMDPSDSFHVMAFQQKCKEAMEDIYARHKIPILVGGTGFYIQSVLYDISFTETDTDIEYRQELQKIAEEQGGYVLHARLAKIDPEAADEIHPNNVKRVIRALEFNHQTGEKISIHNEQERQKKSPYQFRYYVLSLPREILYDRINRRVDVMRRDGLVDEVKGLLQQGITPNMVSMQGLGYKKLLMHCRGAVLLRKHLNGSSVKPDILQSVSLPGFGVNGM